MVIDYYSERIQTKMSKEKAFVRQSPGGTRHQLLVDLSEWSYADRAYFSLPVILPQSSQRNLSKFVNPTF